MGKALLCGFFKRQYLPPATSMSHLLHICKSCVLALLAGLFCGLASNFSEVSPPRRLSQCHQWASSP